DRAGATGQRLENCGREIEDASAVLMRRAGKLAERLDEELAAIHSGGYQQDPEKALRRLLYTMNGVQIATQRNAQAAACFGKLGRLVTKEAERLQSVTRAFRDLDGDASGQADVVLPAAAVPASIGALALKLEQQPAE